MRKAVRSAAGFVWHTIQGRTQAALEHELWLCFFAGVAQQRWNDRKLTVAQGPATRVTLNPPRSNPTLPVTRV
jgi:hypothetical protein